MPKGVLNPHRYTVEDFKKTFKVGDLVFTFRHYTTIKITAIGEQRLLYLLVKDAIGAYPGNEKTIIMDDPQGFCEVDDKFQPIFVKPKDKQLTIDKSKLIPSIKRHF